MEKLERVAELKERIEGSAALLLAEYRGLTVAEISDLRRSLREADTSFAVVKNTLMQRAAAEAGREELGDLLTGPSAVAFVDGDPVAAAKRLAAVTRQLPALVVKGGWMDGRLLSAAEARGLAELESREVMLARVAGLLRSDLSKMASLLASTPAKILALFQAYRETRPSDAAEDDAEAPSDADAPNERDDQPAIEPDHEEE
jgi:large subunit ribosomal protein L10